jgi:hypothetical protein
MNSIKLNKENLKQFAMPLSMVAFSMAIYFIGLGFVSNKPAWSIGILFGLVMSLLKIWLMEVTFKKAVQMPEARAKIYAQRHYMLRYLLTGIVLVIAAIEPTISLLGVFFGLCSMKVGAYATLLVAR